MEQLGWIGVNYIVWVPVHVTYHSDRVGLSAAKSVEMELRKVGASGRSGQPSESSHAL